MPIYEYLCEGCGRITEVMQKISDPAPRTCSECGSRKIAKLVSRTSFQLKGGGWYSDLYASKKPSPGEAKGSGDASPSGGAATGGSTSGDGASAKTKTAEPAAGGAKAPDAKPTGAKPAKSPPPKKASGGATND